MWRRMYKGSILHRCLNKFSLPDIIGMLVRSSLHWQLVLWIITIMKVLLTSMWRQHFEILCVLQISCWYSIVDNDVKIEELYEKLRQYPEIMKTSPHKNTGDLFYLNRIQKLNQSCHIFPQPLEETRNYVVLCIVWKATWNM